MLSNFSGQRCPIPSRSSLKKKTRTACQNIRGADFQCPFFHKIPLEEGLMIFDDFLRDLPGVPLYHSFLHEDVNPLGGTKKIRLIHAPNDAMRLVHARLIRYLRSIAKLPYATGAVPKSSPLKNAEFHRQQRYFYLVDIRKFFPSIQGEPLTATICSCNEDLRGSEKKVLQFLREYCLDNDRLITGAPASPDLANIFMGVRADRQLGELCRKYGLLYTRYLDDLTFSSKSHPIGDKKRKALREVILNIGLEINHRKCGYYNIKKKPVIITGVGVRYGGGTFLPRHYVQKLRGMIFLAKYGEIPPAKVHGHMGTFFSTTNIKEREHFLTEVDWKLLEEYGQVRHHPHCGWLDEWGPAKRDCPVSPSRVNC